MTRISLVDPNVRDGLVDALASRVPTGWQVGRDLAAADVLITENVDVDAGLLARAGDGVRLVVALDTGEARIDIGSIPLLSVPNTALIGVAEHAVALILASLRRLVAVDRATRARAYLPDRAEPVLTNQRDYTYNWIGLEDFGTLYGRSVGLVGLGYIGRATAARRRPFGAKLRYTQRTRLSAEEERALGVEYRSLDDLLAESDVVSLHHRFSEGEDGNDEQFGREAFARMKPGAVFVNTARGRLVDEAALADALERGQIGFAALDVFRYEPLPEGHPFLSIDVDRLLLTPHVAGGPIDEAWRLIADAVVDRLTPLLEERTDA